MTIRSFDVSAMTYLDGLHAAKDACQQRYHKAVKDRYDAWVRRDDLARSHAATEARVIGLCIQDIAALIDLAGRKTISIAYAQDAKINDAIDRIAVVIWNTRYAQQIAERGPMENWDYAKYLATETEDGGNGRYLAVMAEAKAVVSEIMKGRPLRLRKD